MLAEQGFTGETFDSNEKLFEYYVDGCLITSISENKMKKIEKNLGTGKRITLRIFGQHQVFYLTEKSIYDQIDLRLKNICVRILATLV